VARDVGLAYDQSGTSHVVFRHPKAGRLSVPAGRPIKPVYIRMFLQSMDKIDESHED
jgi:predicted RNA binding protein YcfA (HicA-like mRNA interferase family)